MNKLNNLIDKLVRESGKEIVFLPIKEEGFLTQLRKSDRREENKRCTSLPTPVENISDLTFHHFHCSGELEYYS